MDSNDARVECENDYLAYLEFCKESGEEADLDIEYFIEKVGYSNLEKHHREQLRKKYGKGSKA